MRLDKYLQNFQKSVVSRSQLARWIREGHVLVNGKPAKASYLVKSSDCVEVSPPKVKPTELTPEPLPLDILYEDDDLIVINKSPDMVVHPGAGHREKTLVHALLSHCRGLSSIGGVERPGIVHRLDKGTSGVMVVAKNDVAHQHLADQFKNHQIKKTYWAFVYGCPRDKKGTIETLIARSPHHRKKFAVSRDKGKQAITHYRVLKSHAGVSLLEIDLETGRTHQIRVHLTDLGHSLLGDSLYGGHAKKVKNLSDTGLRKKVEALTHPLLHSRKIVFKHPVTGKKIKFTAEVPEDFGEIRELF